MCTSTRSSSSSRRSAAEHKAYLHRSGRTARAGNSGDVVTVVLPEQRKDHALLMRKAGINVRPQQVTADCPPVADLVGEVAAYQAPAPKPVQHAPANNPRRPRPLLGREGASGRTGAGNPSPPRPGSDIRGRSPVMLSAGR